jgi:TonB family protein
MLTLSVQGPATQKVDDLAAARSMYAAAAYEEALARLAGIAPDDPQADEADVYRALCAVALGRTAEAEGALERILRRSPSYVLHTRSVSPRLVDLWTGVRARTLRTHAVNLYTLARRRFDAGQYDRAIADLRQVITITTGLPDPDLIELRTLAEGFLKLAAAMPQPEAPPGEEEPDSTRVFTPRDRNVVGPVEINREIPPWHAPAGTPRGLYQGLVEIVVDERGRVETATLTRSVAASFDPALLEATTRWRFQPALLGGRPVKYRRAFEIIVYAR